MPGPGHRELLLRFRCGLGLDETLSMLENRTLEINETPGSLVIIAGPVHPFFGSAIALAAACLIGFCGWGVGTFWGDTSNLGILIILGALILIGLFILFGGLQKAFVWDEITVERGELNWVSSLGCYRETMRARISEIEDLRYHDFPQHCVMFRYRGKTYTLFADSSWAETNRVLEALFRAGLRARLPVRND